MYIWNVTIFLHIPYVHILALKDLMMVQWRTEICRPTSNKRL